MKNDKNLIVISLGSNTGNSQACMDKALNRIAVLPHVELAAVSGRYCTEPQEDKNQPWFFNQVAALNCWLAPLELLHCLQEIETGLGRVREAGRRFGPRSLDLDLLLGWGQGGEIRLNLPELILPHPRLWQRAFVLVPLRELTNVPACPDLAQKIDQALNSLDFRLEGNKIYQT